MLINATNWTGSQRPNLAYQISTTVDIENGWIFHSFYGGFSIWDARTNPADPQRVALFGGWEGAISGWDPAGEFTQVVFGIAPGGVHFRHGGDAARRLRLGQSTKSAPASSPRTRPALVYRSKAPHTVARTRLLADVLPDRSTAYRYDMPGPPSTTCSGSRRRRSLTGVPRTARRRRRAQSTARCLAAGGPSSFVGYPAMAATRTPDPIWTHLPTPVQLRAGFQGLHLQIHPACHVAPGWSPTPAGALDNTPRPTSSCGPSDSGPHKRRVPLSGCSANSLLADPRGA